MKGVETRIFLGSPLTSEVRMHLAESEAWKRRHIAQEEEPLEEVVYSEIGYLGRYLQSENSDLELIRMEERKLRDQLQRYCSGIDAESLPIVLFPQLFLH